MPVFTGFGFSIFRFFGFVGMPIRPGFVPFRRLRALPVFPESGDGLPQLVDLFLLLGYLRLDAGRILGGEIFECQPLDYVAPVSRHHTLVASDGHVDVHMAELVHGLAQCAALDHEHRRVCRAQGVERYVLVVDSFPRGAELPLDRRRVQDPFQVPDRVEVHRVGIPVGGRTCLCVP